MTEPRDIGIIGVHILMNVPEEKSEFRKAVHDFVFKHLPYCSPEMRRYPETWRLFEDTVMHRFIPQPNEPWEIKIVDIYVGKLIIDANAY